MLVVQERDAIRIAAFWRMGGAAKFQAQDEFPTEICTAHVWNFNPDYFVPFVRRDAQGRVLEHVYVHVNGQNGRVAGDGSSLLGRNGDGSPAGCETFRW